MTIERLTAEDLDHLQRTGFEPPRLGPESHLTQAPLGLRTLVRVAGIGRLEKTQHTPFGDTSGTRCNGDPQPSRDLLVTLYNYQVPLAFMVSLNRARRHSVPAHGFPKAATVLRRRRTSDCWNRLCGRCTRPSTSAPTTR